MVVLQRNELARNRIIFILTLILAAFALGAAAMNFSTASDGVKVLLVVIGAAAAAAVALSLVQLYAFPKRSQILLFQTEDGMVIATNAIHEGFKFRFLRDILGENVSGFSDDDRLRWKDLEHDGFYAALYIRGVRKLIVLRLCTMMFDDVFFADRSNRWEHHDSASTSEPSFSRREMPRLSRWKTSA